MATVVQISSAGRVELAEAPELHVGRGEVRVRTLYSGISAGTELTAYRGSNPYLNKRWDPTSRLFVSQGSTISYPVVGWGYEEVGEVVEVGAGVTDLRTGDIVWGGWGHRSEAVVAAAALSGHQLAAGLDPLYGVFARVGAVALNAVLAADIHLGEQVVIFGQGVIGLLATRLSTLSGATVTAVDRLAPRLELAAGYGAQAVLDAGADSAAVDVRNRTAGRGADVCIELSGSYRALHEAIRTVTASGRVVAAGFYQEDAVGLRLGEEFHHNRIEIVASQISAVPARLASRWTVERLQQTFMSLLADGRVEPGPLISHVIDATDVGSAFELLDQRPAEALQVVLRFAGR